MIDQKLLAYYAQLDELGLTYEIVEHPLMPAVPEVLNYLKLTPADSLPALILKADTGYIALLSRGDCRVHFKKVKKLLGVKNLRLATPAELIEVTGLPVGAARVYTPNLKTLLDQKIFEKEFLIGGSGSFTSAIWYKTADLVKIPDSVVIDATE